MIIFKRIATLSVLVIMLFFNIKTITFADDIMFYNMTTENGLSQNTITTIFQDSNGYIWIGTKSGLNKYNGFDFKLYKNNLDENQSIIDGNITCLAEDLEKNLWVGTNDGLSKIHLPTNTIRNYSYSNSNLYSNKIRDLKIDSNGNVIIATSNALIIYDKANDNFIPIYRTEIEESYTVIDIELYEDNYIYGIHENNFFKYDRLKDTFTIINTEILDKIDAENIFTNLAIHKDTIYLGTSKHGIYTYDIKSDTLTKSYDIKSSVNPEISLNIQYIFPDDDNLWIGTKEGLYVYEEYTTMKHYNQTLFNKYSLINDDVKYIFKDSSSLLWIGTFSGLSTLDYDQKIHYYNTLSLEAPTSSSTNLLLSIFQDNNNDLWLSTYKSGIVKINKKTNEKTYINTKSKNPLSNNIIWNITGNDKYVFAATENGLNIIDTNTLEIKVLSDELNDPFTYSLYLDGNYLWVGTKGGFNIVDLNDFSVKSLNPLLKKYNIDVSYGGPIFKDSKGIYWLGTSSKDGLIRLDPSDYSLTLFKYNGLGNSSLYSGISDNTIISIAEDSKGNIWFGTESGLNKYDPETNTFKSYFISDGLSSNTICSITPYGNDELWISTKSGIDYLKFDNDEIVSVKKYLTGTEFNDNCFHYSKNYSLYFGARDGLYLLNTDIINSDNYTPLLKFDSIKVNGNDYTNSNNFSVKYKEHNIYVKLFTDIFNNSQNIKFYYRMSENDDWILLDKNSVVFSNLAANDYNIQFKAKNFNGKESAIQTLSFTVNPPFWRSDLAKVMYFIIGLIMIIYYILKLDFLTNAVIVKDSQLELEMKEKNRILQHNIKLEKRKNNYLINMSHELRTPLNIISSVQQLILNLNKKGPIPTSELHKYMTMSGNNINRLLKIINDLVDSSNIDEGRYKLFVEEKDIIFIVEECVLSFSKLSEEKEIQLIFDTEIEECIMKFDQSAIERCISNIVENALNFTKAGGEVFVNISTQNEYLKIDVIDNGIGISQENLVSIFDRFSQEVNSDRETLKGSGLGLTITKRLIELHKGKIYVQSKINKGSTFTILLPMNNSDI